MSFLAPWALLLAAAAGVPLLLHLLRRRTGTRVEFPALRYLLRAEKEHAREVRLRNLLLMLLRVGIVVAVAMAMARPVGILPGFGHPPTAVALVLDNSLSSAAADARGPMLSRLVDAARQVVDAAGRGDELAVVTVDGEAVTGSADDLRRSLGELRALDAAGSLPAAIARAQALLDASALPEKRLVVLSDGQATSWRGVDSLSAGPARSPTTVFLPEGELPANRAVASLTLEPPQWSPRGTLRATLSGDSASWRLVVDGQSVARGTAAPGEPIIARVQPSARGWVAGTLELEPDELRGDDLRHFAVFIGEAPAVAVDAASGAFLRGAVDALIDAGRARRGNRVYVGAAERAARPALLFAPSDPLRVADANRALERAGIPWRFGTRRSGASPIRGLGDTEAVARVWYDLRAVDASATDTLARVGAQPWAVAGEGFVLVASPADGAGTDLPVRAGFVPWLDAVLASYLGAAGGAAQELPAGARVTVPNGVDALELADGSLRAVVAGSTLRAPWSAGVSFWRRGERRVAALVVNPEPEESLLERLPREALAARLGAASSTANPASLPRITYEAGGRRALVTPLLILALGLLVAESFLARRGSASAAAD